MEDDRHARLMALFERASERPVAERAAFVEKASGEDTALRDELLSLLEAHDSASGYFDALAANIVSPAYASITGPGRADRESALLPQLQAELQNSYRIEREITGGAMSRVFLAEEIRLRRRVVIKVLPPELAASVSGERFRREIQVAAQLQHPHIVPLLTSESSGAFLYYTMPFVAGESLRARLAHEGALPIAEAKGIWRDVLDVLAHAHANGVVHRDIKPANILLSGRNALVTDFGIARAIEAAGGDAQATATGLAIGTPAYMAPEQATGSADADHRVDIYAAGLVMYEMVEGKQPFSAASTRELLRMRVTTEPAPLRRADCPPELADLVLRCLATDPAARPQTAEAVLAALAVPPAPVVSRRRLHRATYAVAAIVIAVAVFGATQLRRGSDDRGASTLALSVAPQPSIAVLPLANHSPDAGDAPLADGMTEELIARLGRAGNLRVVPSTSVLAFNSRGMSVQQIADSLRVSHVLEGGFQKVGSRLRMQVRLVDARDGSTQWQETYDRAMNDILAVQDDIAGAITRELDVRLAGGERAVASSRRYTPNIAAYEWYLRGMDVALLRSDSGRRRGMEYFNRAIAADSNFAAAYAGLVRMHLGFSLSSTRGDQQERTDDAMRAARRAVTLDDSLAEAQAALGWALLGKQRYAEAERTLSRAVALDRNVPRGHEGLARAYVFLGQPARQLAAARVGVENDPFSHSAIRELALALSVHGRCDEALVRLRPLKALTPPAFVAGIISGQCYATKQMWPEAIAEFRWALDNSSSAAALSFLGYALARSGQPEEARKILADLLSGRRQSSGAFGIAVVYAGLRDYDRAFVWLNKAVDENTFRVYIMSPLFADLHGDPRFDRLRTRLGIQNR